MKFIYIFSLAGILSSQIYAQNDKDFINESWYNSAEMKSTADLVKIYDQNCVTQENEACSQLGASILEKFKNPEFTESAIYYLMLKTHPKVENYSNGEFFYYNGLRMHLTNIALDAKINYITEYLKSKDFAEQEHEYYFSTLKEDFYKSSSLHHVYASSACEIERASFTSGSGSSNTYMICKSEYNLRYMSTLNTIISIF